MLFPEIVDRIGWVLIHSTWQIAVIASLFALGSRFLFRRSASARYLSGFIAMLVMMIMPTATFFLVSSESRTAKTSELKTVHANSADEFEDAENVKSATVLASFSDEGPVDPDKLDTPSSDYHNSTDDAQPSTASSELVGADVLVDASNATKAPVEFAVTTGTNVPNANWLQRVGNFLQPAMHWIVCLWLGGVLLLCIRPLYGLYVVGRLRRVGRGEVGKKVSQLVSRLSRRMKIRRAVEVAQSTLLEIPAVVGSFRPLLLLPTSALTGLTTQQLEAVIAHELAHIRRHDYIVNFLQTLLETVLFYHPAVWWVSHLVRQERENCCDDEAIAICKDRAAYADALVSLDALRASVPPPAVAGNGGSLLQRIRRIVEPDAVPLRGLWPSGIIVVLIFFVVCGLFVQQGTEAVDEKEETKAEALVTVDELEPLDPTGWRGEAMIKLEGRKYDAVDECADNDDADDKEGEEPKAENDRHAKSIANTIDMKLALIPAGTFMMGSRVAGDATNEADRKQQERAKQHLVTISTPFYMGTTEVTQKQWKSVMRTTPWKENNGEFKPNAMEGDSLPASHISWKEAVKFCKKLSEKEGRDYSLPTEAQWEYACRAKTTSAYSFGDDPTKLSDHAWWRDVKDQRSEKPARFPREVAKKLPNKFGLFDMHGNTSEWCSDWYGEDYYSNSPAVDPVGPLENGTNFKVFRGGSFLSGALQCQSAYRERLTPTFGADEMGFRVVSAANRKENDDAKETLSKEDLAKVTTTLIESINQGNLADIKNISQTFDLKSVVNLYYHALGSPNADVVEFLRDETDLNMSDLQIAAIRGDAKAIDEVLTKLDAGSRLSALKKDAALDESATTQFSSFSPFSLAVRNGHIDCVKMLIGYGATVHESAHYTHTPLANAAERGHVDVVKLLLAEGAKVDAIADGYTALMRSSIAGQDETTKVLLEAGADPNQKRGGIPLALHYASKSGNVQCVELLLEYDADVTALDSLRMTALDHAKQRKHKEVIRVLQEAEAKAKAEDILFPKVKVDQDDVEKFVLDTLRTPYNPELGGGSWQRGAWESQISMTLWQIKQKDLLIETLVGVVDGTEKLNSVQRGHAVKHLGQIAPTKAIPLFVESVKANTTVADRYYDCIHEINALGNIGEEAIEAVPVLTSLLNSQHITARSAALDALIKIAPGSVEVMNAIAKRFADLDGVPIEHNEIDEASVVYELARFGEMAKPLGPTFEKLLESKSKQVQIWAAYGLIKSEANEALGFKALMEFVAKGDADDRGVAATAVAALGKQAESTLMSLDAFVDDPDPRVARRVRNAISRIKADDRIKTHAEKAEEVKEARKASRKLTEDVLRALAGEVRNEERSIELRVDLVDAKGELIPGKELSVRTKELKTSQPREENLDFANKQFSLKLKPAQAVEFLFKDGDDAKQLVSNSLTMVEPGEYHIRVTHNPHAEEIYQLTARPISRPAATETADTSPATIAQSAKEAKEFPQANFVCKLKLGSISIVESGIYSLSGTKCDAKATVISNLKGELPEEIQITFRRNGNGLRRPGDPLNKGNVYLVMMKGAEAPYEIIGAMRCLEEQVEYKFGDQVNDRLLAEMLAMSATDDDRMTIGAVKQLGLMRDRRGEEAVTAAAETMNIEIARAGIIAQYRMKIAPDAVRTMEIFDKQMQYVWYGESGVPQEGPNGERIWRRENGKSIMERGVPDFDYATYVREGIKLDWVREDAHSLYEFFGVPWKVQRRECVPELIKLLDDPNKRVRSFAVLCLAHTIENVDKPQWEQYENREDEELAKWRAWWKENSGDYVFEKD